MSLTNDQDDLITSGVIPVPASVREAAANLIGHASIAVTTLNVLCTVVGGAVLALPTAIDRMSFLPGVIFMVVSGALSWLAVVLVARACARTGLLSFQDLVLHASNNNPIFTKFFFFGLLAFPFGIIVAFMKVIAESMPAVMKFMLCSSPTTKSEGNNCRDDGSDMILVTEGFWIIAASAVLIPLSSLREMSELVWVSVIGFGTVVFTGFSVIYLFFSGRYTSWYNPAETPSTCTDWWLNHTSSSSSSLSSIALLHDSLIHPGIEFFNLHLEDFFVAFPLMTMALTCHNNVPFYYGELKRRSEARMMTAIYIAGSFTTVFYLAVGICGYFVFGNSVRLSHGNVLNCLSWNDTLVMMSRALMAVHFLCVYPLNCISARRVLNRIIYPETGESRLSRSKLVLEAFILVGLSAIVAYKASGIEAVFSINGSLFGLLLTFVLPAFCYLRLVNPCSLSDFWKASRTPLETSSLRSEEDQELSDVDELVEGEVSACNGNNREDDDLSNQNLSSSSSSSSGFSSSASSSNTDASSGSESDNNCNKKNKSGRRKFNRLGPNDDDNNETAANGMVNSAEQANSEVQDTRKSTALVSAEVVSFGATNIQRNGIISNEEEEEEDRGETKAKENDVPEGLIFDQRISPENHNSDIATIPRAENDAGIYVENQQHHHHHRDLSELTSPRQVRSPSSVFWRVSVWFLLVWGSVGTVCSFVFSVQALFTASANDSET